MLQDHLVPRAPKAWAPNKRPPPYDTSDYLVKGDTWPEVLGGGGVFLWGWNGKYWVYINDNIPTPGDKGKDDGQDTDDGAAKAYRAGIAEV